MPTKKLLGAAAIMAALAGGGVAGALLGAPSVTSAQESDDSTTTTEDPTSTSADEAAEDDDELEGYCLGRPGRLGARLGLGAAADALGMTRPELHEALEDSGTIAAVAEAQGVDLQTVVDAMVAAATERIDEALEDGRIAEDRAEELKEALPERIAELVQRELPEGGFVRHRHGHRPPLSDDETDADAEVEEDAGS